MEKEVKKILTSIEVPAVGKATALVPNIQFIAETFNISNFVNNNINNAVETLADNNVFPDYVAFSYDDAMTIARYINSIKDALLNK